MVRSQRGRKLVGFLFWLPVAYVGSMLIYSMMSELYGKPPAVIEGALSTSTERWCIRRIGFLKSQMERDTLAAAQRFGRERLTEDKWTQLTTPWREQLALLEPRCLHHNNKAINEAIQALQNMEAGYRKAGEMLSQTQQAFSNDLSKRLQTMGAHLDD